MKIMKMKINIIQKKKKKKYQKQWNIENIINQYTMAIMYQPIMAASENEEARKWQWKPAIQRPAKAKTKTEAKLTKWSEIENRQCGNNNEEA